MPVMRFTFAGLNMKNKISINFPRGKLFVLLLLLLLILSIILFVIYQYKPFDLNLLYIGISSFSIIVLLSICFYPIKNKFSQKKQQKEFKPQNNLVDLNIKTKQLRILYDDIIQSLRSQYGFYWHSKVSIYLLIGSHPEVEQLAPNLTQDIWQLCDGTLLIYGGDIDSSVEAELLDTLKQLRRRPLDGVIWVTENQVTSQPLENQLSFTNLNTITTDRLGRYAQHLFQAIRWRAPVWVWGVSDNAALCAEDTPAVLCLAEPNISHEALSPTLLTLLPALIAQGTRDLLRQPTHTYLLILAEYLRAGGSQQLGSALAPLFSRLRQLPFAGIVFSTPAVTPSGQSLPHTWQPDSRWSSWLAAQQDVAPSLKAAPLGISSKRIVQYTAATAMVVWGVGMVVSYLANRQLIRDSHHYAVAAANPTLTETARLTAQYDFQQTLGLLSHREQTYVPLWLRFGLDHNEALLTHLWPLYQQKVLPELRQVVSQQWTARLHTFAQLPPDSAERAEATAEAYQALKAYLMMVTPERMDAPFFIDAVLSTLAPPQGVSQGEWHTRGQELLQFYARELPRHPEWALRPDSTLISRSRTLLIRQIGQRSESAAMYQKILLQAQDQFADMTLNEMAGETDVGFLLTTEEFVPGIFTRKAWEEVIEPAIDKAVAARRNEIDWVLSDSQQHLDSDISPEHLKQQLTERYFADFSGSWLNFLNSLQWRQTESLADTIDQLSLMSDVRQSPIIALMNTVAYQGKTGRQTEKLSDSFVNSAKEFINKEKTPVISQKAEFTGPLEEVFGPVLNFVDPQASSQAGDNLSLQAYLTRVTRVRLKLQQVVNAPDPQAMSQSLAKSVFEGKTVDLSETRDYGSLIAASLGQEWQHFGETLLVEPMGQAWQQLLTPTAQGINHEWQNAIVKEWQSAFGGRYPLKNTQSNISLPLLGQYLRPDNGRIQRFLETRLQGVLRKEGNHWVPDSTHAQGLRFNPAFLAALDTLSELGDVVFADGEARVYFEMRPGTSKSVMQTTLVIDKQNLTYDNQFPSWQRFVWPGDTVASGAALMWMTTTSGTRIYGDYPGTWGLIRLLETATVTPYAGSTSSYTVSWQTLGGNSLSYTLRTEIGEGPLALLKLRNFVLPEKIFLE